MINEIKDEAKLQMEDAVDYFKSQLAKVRTGRASASLLDGVKVDYYGSQTPLEQAAGVSVPDAKTIMVQPYDRNMLAEIEKAIRAADLGFNPQNDGNVIRIPVPPLTEERRQEFVKVCKKYAEESKVSVRNARRDANDALKKAEKDKNITEDDKKHGEDEIQKLTDKYVKQIDEILAVKEKELLDQ